MKHPTLHAETDHSFMSQNQPPVDSSRSIKSNSTTHSKSVSFKELHGQTDSNPLIDTSVASVPLAPPINESEDGDFDARDHGLQLAGGSATVTAPSTNHLPTSGTSSDVRPLSSPTRANNNNNNMPMFDDPTLSFESNPNFSGNTTNRSEQLASRLQRLMEARENMVNLLEESGDEDDHDQN